MDFCIAGLIPDLQDVICTFAYKCTAKKLREDINTVVMIKSWNMPQSFFKARVRCEPSDFLCVYSRYVDNPVKHFIPSHLFGGGTRCLIGPTYTFCFCNSISGLGSYGRLGSTGTFGTER